MSFGTMAMPPAFNVSKAIRASECDMSKSGIELSCPNSRQSLPCGARYQHFGDPFPSLRAAQPCQAKRRFACRERVTVTPLPQGETRYAADITGQARGEARRTTAAITA